MQENEKNTAYETENTPKPRNVRAHLALFGNVRVLTLSAMLAAMSTVLAVLAKALFGTSFLRVTIENLPILFAGMAFGPFIGAVIAVAADLLSCLIAGQAPVPLIAVGAALMGIVGGILGSYVFRRRTYPQVLAVALLTHLVGTITVKTAALHVYFGYSWLVLLPRLPVYLGIAVLESVLLYLLFRNKEITRWVESLCQK